MRGLPIIFNLFRAENKDFIFWDNVCIFCYSATLNQSIMKKNSENSIENKRHQKLKVKWNSKISYSDIIAKSEILSVVVQYMYKAKKKVHSIHFGWSNSTATG